MTEIQKHTTHHDSTDRDMLGYWIYLMTDLIMFSVLFASYAVLHKGTFGGPSGKELFNLPFALIETLILLTSSFTSGLGMLFARIGQKGKTLFFFIVTFLLGISFLTMELSEFSKMAAEGNVPQKSAFLSSFFTLVGTHGLHIASGLLWLLILLVAIFLRGLTPSNVRKLNMLSIFWHFLDIVWIFIFTIVYLFGGMGL